ncbi:MAG TPA: hypothetical protein VHW66_09385 [Stellaceae bacterium]|jgi:hypothetical protein|nr:hypothetical protein [Stellaceae bacterium]
MRVETIAEYEARGGKITRCPAAGGEARWEGVIERVWRTQHGHTMTVVADRGSRFRLSGAEWFSKIEPAKGMRVSFWPDWRAVGKHRYAKAGRPVIVET